LLTEGGCREGPGARASLARHARTAHYEHI
jgi:hypothetical protein